MLHIILYYYNMSHYLISVYTILCSPPKIEFPFVTVYLNIFPYQFFLLPLHLPNFLRKGALKSKGLE